MLNLENGLGVIWLSPSWQSVIRGAFLLVVVLQSRLGKRSGGRHGEVTGGSCLVSLVTVLWAFLGARSILTTYRCAS
jgi:hypothetical protein